jgi:glycosyltransferase involved in cell wall biosynthesis
VALRPVFTAEDHIGQVTSTLLENDLAVVILDNGSTDDSYAICEKFSSLKNVKIAQWFPQRIDLEALTLKLYRLAMRQAPDWLLFSDGDELAETERAGRTLRQVIEDAEKAGSNILQYDRFDFFMTDLDDSTIRCPVERLSHYSWQGDFNYRAFKSLPGTTAVPSFAHYPIFPPSTPYVFNQEKLVLRHYPYRSPLHARRKIDNLVRKIRAEGGDPKGWQKRYLRLAEQGQCFGPVDAQQLTRYDGDYRWNTQPRYTPFISHQPQRIDIFDPAGFLKWRSIPSIDWSAVVE